MRRDDWVPRLLEYIEASRARPLDAVRFNCALFALGAVCAMRGDESEQVLRDALGIEPQDIASERDVARLLIERGGVRGLAAEFFGTDELLPPLQVCRGDVVIKDGVDGETLGVCVGDHCLFVVDDGLQQRGLLEVKGGWHVV